MTPGREWLIDASGCRPVALCDPATLRSICERIIADLELCVVGVPLWHVFPEPGGLTGLYLLSESHLTCHTFPELGLAAFNLYCCRPRPEWPWESRLAESLGATHVRIRSIQRGLDHGAAESLSGDAQATRLLLVDAGARP